MSIKADRALAKSLAKSDAIDTLVNYFNLVAGSQVLVSIDHVSKSGMSRNMRLFTVMNGELINITTYVALALGEPIRDDSLGRRTIRVQGCGMDMAFHLVSNLAWALHGDGYALNKRDI